MEPNPLLATNALGAATAEARPNERSAAYKPHQQRGGANSTAIVEFDATQFDGQGISSQQLM